ncbi:MAG: hypothetical protein JWR51_4685 [Devosia sp.]|uniref:hypothetical protein n=1 Tax=Devosia sp. TaxID=1871048 RepID=UPI0026190169|nr:hypothetical protein [Devosia sp.]MDB5531582.1 hypothetical protein [Devosia sp.]
MTVTEADDEFLKRIAHILGSETAASRAMAERDRRKAAGEDAVIYWNRDNGSLIVGPRLPA